MRYEPETVEDQGTIDSFGGLDNTPPYLVRLRPVLTLDGERLVVAQDGLPMGADYTLNIDIVTPNGTERITSNQIIGNLAVIGIVSQNAQLQSPSVKQTTPKPYCTRRQSAISTAGTNPRRIWRLCWGNASPGRP
ncbi:hypothetical protein [Geotalea toluenoxydans]|uniref:hypothetical protein n=1 Tax=Geotalea toluenoxydans TaxID=421624 RepID=UPI0006D062BF|nr:hypothetical protein [Geotalea toluenoxydans]